MLTKFLLHILNEFVLHEIWLSNGEYGFDCNSLVLIFSLLSPCLDWGQFYIRSKQIHNFQWYVDFLKFP